MNGAPWRWPPIEDEVAQARTVVLREVDARARELVFFTDARSPKVAQIQARPVGTMLCWSSRISWQLRLRVHLECRPPG